MATAKKPSSKKITEQPKRGDQVWYYPTLLTDGYCGGIRSFPAIVTNVYEGGQVALTVFFEDRNPETRHPVSYGNTPAAGEPAWGFTP